MTHIKPTYSDDEVFAMIEMTLGAPPDPISPRYRGDPAFVQLVNAGDQYYNDVTSFLTTLFPDDFMRMYELRTALYRRHKQFTFDFAKSPY
jgi:hypothetical protein